MKTPLLIHYGSDRFEADLLKPIKNNSYKPRGGLWGSPVNSGWGWKAWCADSGFALDSFGVHFNFFVNGEILIISSLQDLQTLPLIEAYGCNFFDYEAIAQSYDAIWLTEEGQTETHLSYPWGLYGWDCESVLVFNSESIEAIA